MNDIGNLLDACGISYTDKQLAKLDKLFDELLKKLFSSSRGQRDDSQLWAWNSGRRSGPAAAAGGQHTAAVVRRPSDGSACPSTRIWLHFLRFPGTGEDGVKLISSASLALKRPWRQNCRAAHRIFKRGSNFPAVPYRLVNRYEVGTRTLSRPPVLRLPGTLRVPSPAAFPSSYSLVQIYRILMAYNWSPGALEPIRSRNSVGAGLFAVRVPLAGWLARSRERGRLS